MDAIVLAGGLGTRLKTVLPHLPKPLASINGVPFLDLLLKQLSRFKRISKVILAIGYKAEAILEHTQNHPSKLPLDFSIEESPLGTGGALKKAFLKTSSDPILILNGDSFFAMDLEKFTQHHLQTNADLTIASLEIDDCNRYGGIAINPETNRLLSFKEKEATQARGLINGGVYLMNRNLQNEFPENSVFSLEKEFFPKILQTHQIKTFITDAKFIDIGTPESYKTAQEYLIGI